MPTVHAANRHNLPRGDLWRNRPRQRPTEAPKLLHFLNRPLFAVGPLVGPMSAAIRPQLKDLHTCGFDARSSIDGKKQKALQPPMNASPGELRLWRKLNGLGGGS